MNIEDLVPMLFFSAFALIIGMFIYRYFKFGGFKGALFGAKITQTLGQVSGGKFIVFNSAVKVHKLSSNSPERAVGLEFINKGFASYHMFPITLSITETNRLIMLLQEATNLTLSEAAKPPSDRF